MGSRISLHLRPARDFNQVAAAKLQTMKLLFPSLLLFLGVLGAFADPPMPAEGEEGSHSPPYYALANYLQQQKRAQASALERELLAEYLANQMGSPDYLEPEVGRAKRWWGGNKYRDNKSYGFWITALNKAGNVKRERDQHSSHPWEPLWMITILLQDLLTTPTWLSWCQTRRPPLLCTMSTSKIRTLTTRIGS